MFKNQIRIGIILSFINLALSSIIPFIYTPIMLRLMGQSEYGLYSLASSVIGYLSLLSFGFGSTIIRYISKYRAENDKESVEMIFGFFLAVYSILALVVMLCGGVITLNIEAIFGNGLILSEIEKMKSLVLIMAFNCAVSFPISVFSAMITSYEKYFYRKLIDILLTIVAPIVNLIALSLGLASVGMAFAGTITQILILPLNAIYCFRSLNLKLRFRRIPFMLLKEMLGFSVFVFVGSIVDMLFWGTDKVILGMLVGSTAVAIYNVGGTFNNMIMNFSTSISGVLIPKITGMVVKDVPKEMLSELFIKVGRLQFIIIALIMTGFSVFGECFIDLWAGPEYSDSYWVTILTMFPLCIPLIQNTGLSIITAQNKHKFRSIVYLIVAIMNVASTYLIVPYMGIIGAALCSCISYLIGQGIIMNLYYYRVIGLNIPLFWRNIFKMAIVPVCMMVVCLFLRNHIEITNWITFFSCVIVYTIIYSILMYKYSLNDYEKDIFRKPIIIIVNKLNNIMNNWGKI